MTLTLAHETTPSWLVKPLPTHADVERKIEALERRREFILAHAEAEVSAIDDLIEDLGQLSGDLADQEELERFGEAI